MSLKDNWRLWIKGLSAAAIGGAANSISVYIVDPVNFSDFSKLAKVALLSAILGAAFYLKQSPIPPDPISDDENPLYKKKG